MSRLEIILCTNHETLGCDPEQVGEFYNAVSDITIPDHVRLIVDSTFRFWNGGPGYGTGYSCLRIVGFGVVKSIEEARKAVAWLVGTGVNEWPSSDELCEAFDALDLVRQIPIPEQINN